MEQALDPCTNLKLGAAILSENYRLAANKFGAGQRALQAAISAYNTGNHIGGFQNGYVQKVLAAAGGGGVEQIPTNPGNAHSIRTSAKPKTQKSNETEARQSPLMVASQ